MPLMDGLKVVRSGIHGYGVIATRPFKKGEVILYGDGVLYREDDDFDDTYALILPGYETGPDGEEGPPLFWDLACQSRWINHSCDPNSAVDSKWLPEERSVLAWWSALRDIEPGEELTYDYAFTAQVAEPCNCGAAICRGLIVDPDEIDEVPAHLRKYLRAPGRSAAS
ncbi:MAG TPA: SET domain-containing protein-lysine N-methyltransferase [Kofleriaceae bacterium]|nr:SET domain-containing protein-lysine N-methyltransferase [Kofleriaceae bacterium]